MESVCQSWCRAYGRAARAGVRPCALWTVLAQPLPLWTAPAGGVRLRSRRPPSSRTSWRSWRRSSRSSTRRRRRGARVPGRGGHRRRGAGPRVGAVEAAALEHDAHGVEQLAQSSLALRALRQGVLGEGLEDLKAVIARGARVGVRRHGSSLVSTVGLRVPSIRRPSSGDVIRDVDATPRAGRTRSPTAPAPPRCAGSRRSRRSAARRRGGWWCSAPGTNPLPPRTIRVTLAPWGRRSSNTSTPCSFDAGPTVTWKSSAFSSSRGVDSTASPSVW